MNNYNFGWYFDPTNAQMELSEDIIDSFLKNVSNGIADVNGVKFLKREGQETYIREIMSAIKEKKSLVIQAGVGSGKTFGYLIPIIITTNNVSRFNKVIIATSNRALQQQILTDVNAISQMLKINIDVNIVKGMNNYICVNRLLSLIENSETDQKLVTELVKFKNALIRNNFISDRDELPIISNKIWNKIKLENRGKCSNCQYDKAGVCYYQKLQRKIKSDEPQIIVTNQALLSYWIHTKLIEDVDMVVVDEAHNLKDNIKEILGGSLQMSTIENELFRIKKHELDCSFANKRLVNECINNLQDLYKKLRSSAKKYFQDNNPNTWIEPGQETVFYQNDEIKLALYKLIVKLKELSKVLEKNFLYKTKQRIDSYLVILEDFQRENTTNSEDRDYQENYYWVKFIEYSKIELCYSRRKLDKITTFFRKNPTVFTSGTLIGTDGKYTEYIESIFGNREDVGDILKEVSPIKSPFNYKENTIVYYDPTIAMPPTKWNAKIFDEKKYINDLVDRIDRLIRITEGKSLVLFTSIDIMNKVYKEISKKSYDYELMLQDKENSSKIKARFSQETNSCLFATGSFWEGIDIKGESLSNLIITRLPFPTEDADPSIENLYQYKMLVKLQQGYGRGIRTENDKVIISLLDARTKKYLDMIQKVLPTPSENYTSDMDEVAKFAQEKILNFSDKKR